MGRLKLIEPSTSIELGIFKQIGTKHGRAGGQNQAFNLRRLQTNEEKALQWISSSTARSSSLFLFYEGHTVRNILADAF